MNSTTSLTRERTLADFFADSYALMAHLEDRPSYRTYFDSMRPVTTQMNLLEIAYILHRRHGLSTDELASHLAPMRPFVVTPAPTVIPQAAETKHQLRQLSKDVSYIDAWGYATARWLDIPFLTGDEDFRGLDHVEFVKA